MKKAIILAAGEGTRMVSKCPKVLHKVLGSSMLNNVISELKKSEIEEIIVIVGHGKDQVIEEIKKIDGKIKFKEQPIGKEFPYGTGYAVLQALDEIAPDDKVIIVCGDTPLLRGSTLKQLMRSLDQGQASILTAIIENSTGYGRIILNQDGYVDRIVEETEASFEEKSIKEINSGVYAFLGRCLRDNLKDLDTNNSQGELYLTDIVKLLNQKGERVSRHLVEDREEILGVNSRSQLLESERILRHRVNEGWLERGVTIVDIDSTIIGPNVAIGMDTVIYPGARILGTTSIGEGNIIEGDTSIVDSQIGNNCHIKSTYITQAEVGDRVTLGPFAQLRPGTRIEDRAHIGNFVELKNTNFGEGSKAGHLAYLGDADIARDVNIGCGVITANYDGKNKYKTRVGKEAFIGSNSNLVAPISIGDRAYVAAGSTITKDVDPDDLAIERTQQANIKDWVKRKNK